MARGTRLRVNGEPRDFALPPDTTLLAALRDEVAGLLGFAAERVRVHPLMISGTYGTLDTIHRKRAVLRDCAERH